MNCRICTVLITDPEYARVVYREDYPEILIGPYCPTCFPRIRVCSGCQHPFVADATITYHSNGQWFCSACSETLVTCSDCGLLTHQHVQGTEICQDCFNKNNFICTCCNQKRHIHEAATDKVCKLQYPELFQQHPKLCKNCFTQERSKYIPKNILECKHCKGAYPFWTEDHHFCQGCWSHFTKCEDCGYKGPQVSEYVVSDGKRNQKALCHVCIKDYQECGECGSYSKKLLRKRDPFGKTQDVCPSCAKGKSYCLSCFRLILVNSDGLCADCSIEYGSTCECGKSKADHQSKCRGCRGDSDVSSYSFKPLLHFNYFDLSDKIFFGFENEVCYGKDNDASDTKRRAIKHFYKNFSHSQIFLKSDSSITGAGFEVVTHPMTLDFYHKLPLNRLFYGSELKDKSCGLHVHVSRESFNSQVHILKVLDFVYNNKTFTNKVAGRVPNTYNSNLESAKPSEAVLKGKEKERYKRINLSNNKTIEFRLFQGCTDLFELSYRIEYIHAVISWTAVAPIKNQGIKDFLVYVSNNQKIYRNLYNYLKVQGRIK